MSTDNPGSPEETELYAANDKWLFAGELRDYLARFPADMPVTVGTEDGGWLNAIGATNPDETGESSIIIITRDDFDTRQW